jgi:hypothetical protein
MDQKRTPTEMFAEFLREAAVLILVFAPLDMTFAQVSFTPLNVAAILEVSGFLLTLGILLEVVRR